MIRMLALRLARLEQRRPPVARRVVHVYATCQREGESEEAVLLRHGVTVSDRLLTHRYGGPCRLCRGESP
jgi:hypothetical protein